MEGKKSSSHIGLIVFLLLIIIVLIAYIVLNSFSTKNGYSDVISYVKDSLLSGKTVQTSQEGNTQQVPTTTTEPQIDNMTKYASVINEYKYAMENKNEDNNYGANVNSNILTYYHAYNNFDICYAFYDINKDNKDEMIILSKDENSNYTIIDIHGFNGENAVRLINENSVGDRSKVEIFDNGIIYLKGSGGATNGVLVFYKIGEDGYTISSDIYYYVFSDANNVSIYSDVELSNKLEYASIDEVVNKYKGQSSTLVLNTLDIKTIEVATSTTSTPEVDNLTKYASVIEAYKTGMKNKNTDNEYGENVNSTILMYYHSSEAKFDICYAFYDINNDNKDEMIVLSKNDTKYTIIDIHGYNGTKPVRLISNNSVGDRSKVEIFGNGIIYLNGSNGASNGVLEFYKFKEDGYTLESDKMYYFYDETENETPKTPEFYTDYERTNKLSYTSIDEVVNKYKGTALTVNLDSLETNVISVD